MSLAFKLVHVNYTTACLKYSNQFHVISVFFSSCADQTQPGPCLSVKIARGEAGCPPFILSRGRAPRGRCVKKTHSGPGCGGHRCYTQKAGGNHGSPCGW